MRRDESGAPDSAIPNDYIQTILASAYDPAIDDVARLRGGSAVSVVK